MKGKIIIEGNAFYEIDEECLRKSQNQKRKTETRYKEVQQLGLTKNNKRY